jgi:hypothetical protein
VSAFWHKSSTLNDFEGTRRVQFKLGRFLAMPQGLPQNTDPTKTKKRTIDFESMSHALNLSYRFNAAKTHDPKKPLPTKGAGTLRRAICSQAIARILGGRHMECAYYFKFWVDGTWNVPTTLGF